jgi:hypothetical protein
VSVIDGSSFAGSSIEYIFVDDANPNYFVSGPFLMDHDGTRLIRYFGSADHVILNAEYESESDSTIVLRNGSRVKQIDGFAFSFNSILKSICIPASVEILGQRCFKCSSLSQIIFESGSRLAQIGESAFLNCSSLVSICIPAQVEEIPIGCFSRCDSLTDLAFESDSKVVRIRESALEHCSSLRRLAIPSRLEILEFGALSDCESLRELIFEAPSSVKELQLPKCDFGRLSIPDSVEVVYGNIGRLDGQGRALEFGRESSLSSIGLRESYFAGRRYTSKESVNTAFVRLSEKILRRFRCKLEEF